MFEATTMPRIFQMDMNGTKTKLSDPDPSWSVEAVLNFYAGTYPELLSAKAEGPVLADDQVQYTFATVFGTKG